MNVFKRKSAALQFCRDHQIVANNDILKYFILEGYEAFGELVSTTPEPAYYEFIRENANINLFLDIEIHQSRWPEEFKTHSDILRNIVDIVKECFTKGDLLVKMIILESHSSIKKSYHVIVRAFRGTYDRPVYFTKVKDLKALVVKLFRKQDYIKKKIIDTTVYREGLFRTYLSSKSGENRPLVQSAESDDFSFVETFVCYTEDKTYEILDPQKLVESTCRGNSGDSGDDTEVVVTTGGAGGAMGDVTSGGIAPQELIADDKKVIERFIRKNYKYQPRDIREIIIDRQINCIVAALHDTFCGNIDREHTSNHQYIVIDAYSSKQKCHDPDCRDYKQQEIKINEFPKELNEIILKCLKVNKQEQELIQYAIQECKEYITNNFDETISDIEFDRSQMVFRGNASNSALQLHGKCKTCSIEHHITNSGYCLKCSVCHSIFPKTQLIPVDPKYKNLNSFWMNYSQLVNNGTVNININNYYSGEEEFSCNVKLDSTIFRNKELTRLSEQILDGHKVVLLSELLSRRENDFRYTNGDWYFFNGVIWKADKESLELRKRIVKLSSHFAIIQNYYENRKLGDSESGGLVKNVKSLINKLHKTSFEDEIIKGAKMYFNDEKFILNLNSKKHLVPFTNGVFDLLANSFRKTQKEDYINLTFGYPYLDGDGGGDGGVGGEFNREVLSFIDTVLPNRGVKDYVLKKMSECLNGDIPNTNFMMFIGDGANGKSQLLNLMKLAMGEFGEKVEVTLLTRKRNNANESNSEKIKLMYKRFAFLSEPEDGEKINIGLLKELTGSEEIVARGLYQEAVSFVMEAKLFLACNELPEIKGEDTALWRRIRVIDFPSRFVDEPKEDNEYKIDRTLPSRMREDISWRQTFMRVLLDYYYRDDIVEPDEVKLKTNEYRQENNDFYNWLEENLRYKEGCVLKLQETLESFSGKKISSRLLGKYRKEIEKYVKEKIKNVNYEYKQFWIGDQKYKGWLHLHIK
jgi:P4 family phage/plasmid primase-like protien